MTHIKITFPDGSVKDYAKGITAGEIAMQISPRLAEEAVVAKVNGELKDLSHSINEDANLHILKLKEQDSLVVSITEPFENRQ